MSKTRVILISLLAVSLVGAGVAVACHPPGPPIWIDTPGDDVILMGTTTVTAKVRDDIKLQSVEFFAGDQSIGKDDEAPFEIKWDTTSVKNTAHELVAEGTTAEGEKIKSKALAVTVDNTKDS